MIKWLCFWRKKKIEKEHPHNQIRRNVDINSIRARINGIGWKLREIPVRKSNIDPEKRTLQQWRLIASKGEKSIDVSAVTLDEAMKKMGINLGVISKNEHYNQNN
jgi:hypothetical protein